MMRRRLALVLAALLCTTAVCATGRVGTAGAQYRPRPVRPGQGGFVALGQANVDGRSDHDTISIGQAAGVYRAIQLRVNNGPIRFDHLVVRYGNGQTEPLAIRTLIPAGGTSRAIPLSGGGRIVQSVEVWYGKANPNSRKPQVVVFGMR